jgi:hypothetical protein
MANMTEDPGKLDGATSLFGALWLNGFELDVGVVDGQGRCLVVNRENVPGYANGPLPPRNRRS